MSLEENFVMLIIDSKNFGTCLKLDSVRIARPLNTCILKQTSEFVSGSVERVHISVKYII